MAEWLRDVYEFSSAVFWNWNTLVSASPLAIIGLLQIFFREFKPRRFLFGFLLSLFLFGACFRAWSEQRNIALIQENAKKDAVKNYELELQDRRDLTRELLKYRQPIIQPVMIPIPSPQPSTPEAERHSIEITGFEFTPFVKGQEVKLTLLARTLAPMKLYVSATQRTSAMEEIEPKNPNDITKRREIEAGMRHDVRETIKTNKFLMDVPIGQNHRLPVPAANTWTEGIAFYFTVLIADEKRQTIGEYCFYAHMGKPGEFTYCLAE